MTEKQWRDILKFVKAQAKKAGSLDDFVNRIDLITVRSGKLLKGGVTDVTGFLRKANTVVSAAKNAAKNAAKSNVVVTDAIAGEPPAEV